jgi:hypothetical protein
MTTTTPKQKGGARPGAGRIQTIYKISPEAARKLKAIAKHHNRDPRDILEIIINSHPAITAKEQFHDEPMQRLHTELLLTVLKPEPQTIGQIAKLLNISKAQLEQRISRHLPELVERGLHLHTATASEIEKAIKLPSPLNPDEHTYYSKVSKDLFSI